MKISNKVIPFLIVVFCAFGCSRTPSTVWDDTQSATRHLSRGFRVLGGKHGDSRQVQTREEFMGAFDDPCSTEELDFIPLRDDPNNEGISFAERMNRMPQETPGEPGSTLPGIQAFQDPSTNQRWSSIFRPIYFGYNSNLIKGSDNLQILKNIAGTLRVNNNLYIFVEGHCDERGPEAYNLALGAQRANAIRDYLINDGANPDHIFTISYGKERPIVMGQDEDSWRQNRRGEFKIYEK